MIRAWLRRLLELDDTPESIARGVALGFFVAFTPTVGVQMPIVAVVNTIARANRLAGILIVQITNPLTLVPCYWLDYQVGLLVLGREGIPFERFKRLYELESTGPVAVVREFVGNLAALGAEVAVPLFLGGTIVGALLGIASYWPTVSLVRRARRLRARLHDLRARRRARHAERALRRAQGRDGSAAAAAPAPPPPLEAPPAPGPGG